MAGEVPEGWLPLVAELEPHVSPEWVRQAREHAGQGWVRLIALVDAHALLANPRIAEKVASTMSELAEGRPDEQAGWEALREQAGEERRRLVVRVVDAAPEVLPPELTPLFVRSVDPMRAM